MKKTLFLLVAIILILSSFSVVSGMPAGFSFENIKKNDQTFFDYHTKNNLLLNDDVDRIQALFKKLGESLNARVILDEANKSIHVVKPNVQMITANAVGIKDGKLVFEGVFGKGKRGDKVEKFKVYTEIEDLPKGNKDFRLLIDAPNASGYSAEEFVVSPEMASTDKMDATITFDVSNANFSKEGQYNIKLQMKLDGEEVFFTVAEKKIEISK